MAFPKMNMKRRLEVPILVSLACDLRLAYSLILKLNDDDSETALSSISANIQHNWEKYPFYMDN